MPPKSEPKPPPVCPECGGKPGYDPASGIELKQGHFSFCSQWKQ